MGGALISRSLTLISSVAVARLLGKTSFGELGMIQSTVGMFGVLAGFGLGVTATKHVAQFRESDPARAGRIIGLSQMVALISGGLISLGLVAFAPWLAENTINAPHLAGLLQISAFIFFMSALNGAQTGALAGFEAFRTIAQVNILAGVVSLPILLAGTYFGGLRGAVWALAINLLANWLLNHLALRRAMASFSIRFSTSQWSRELPVLWNFSFPVVISGMVAGPTIWVCKSVLANQPDGYASLGLLAVAESWRMVPLFVCTIIAQVNLPIMSQLISEGKMEQFKAALKGQFVVNGVIAGIGAAVVVLMAGPIMTFYGPEFRDNTAVLILVVISTIPMQLTTVVGTANRCIGSVWWNLALNALWAFFLLIGTLHLAQHGALGFAGAICVANMLQFVAAMIYLTVAMRTSHRIPGTVLVGTTDPGDARRR